MSKQNATLAKNFTVLLSSQAATWALTMVLMVFLPRYLGAVNVGKLHLAIALWSIMSVVMAFGMEALMVKEVARDSSKSSSLFGTKAVLGSVIFVLCMAFLIYALSTFNYPQTTIYVVVLIGIEFWIWQLVRTSESVFEGIQKMEHVSIGRISGHALNVAIGVTLLLLGWGIFAISIVRIVAALLVFIIQFITLKRTTSLQPKFDLKLAPTLLKSGWPYFLAGIAMVVYMQLDIVLLSYLVSEEAIGWYGTADQLFGTLLFIPTAYITSIYPIYSKLAVDDMGALKELMSKNFDLMLLVSVPIGLGLFLVGKPVVILLYGAEFANSGPVLSTFGIVLILTYLNMLVGQFLIAIDRQKSWALVMAVATVVTIPLDLWLIPWTHAAFANGALGGAIAFIITEMGMLASGIALLPSGTLGRTNVKSAALVAFSGIFMVLAVWWLRDYFIAIPILTGAVAYISMVLLLKIVPKEDMASFKELTRRFIARFTRRQAITASN